MPNNIAGSQLVSAGTVVARLSISGLALATVTDSSTIALTAIAPVGNDITLDFATGGAASAAVVCNGFTL